MARTDTLPHYLLDVANSIRTKKSEPTILVPNGYTQVEYIATNQHGNYINTGVTASYDTKIEIKYMTVGNFEDNPRPNYCAVAGSYNTSLNAGISIASAVNSTGVAARFDGLTYEMPLNTDNTEIIDINSKDGYYRNGTKLKTWSNATQFTLNQSITIFTCTINADEGITSWQRNARVYYCKIYEDDVLVRHMIPCYRNSDNVTGMYDVVNDVFYTNAAETGVFAKGNDVGTRITASTFDTEIENLPSGGTNPIDTTPATPNGGTSTQWWATRLPNNDMASVEIDVKKASSIAYMFSGCKWSVLPKIKNTSEVNLTLNNAFANCSNVTALDLSGLKAKPGSNKVTSVFNGCNSLTFLDIRNIDFSNASGNYTFSNIPTNCLIIVKDQTSKTWVTTSNSSLTNVKTVAEYENE